MSQSTAAAQGAPSLPSSGVSAGGAAPSSPAAGGQLLPAELAQALQLSNQQISELREANQAQGQHMQRYEQTMSRLREAIAPETVRQGAPTEADLAWYDQLLEMGMAAEKEGRGMPVTMQVATRAAQLQAELFEMRKVVQEMRDQQERAADPVVAADLQAFTQIDGIIEQRVSETFGDLGNFKAVADSVVSEVIRLQDREPRVWEQIRRSPQAMQILVDSRMAKFTPPAMKQMAETQRIQTMEFSSQDCLDVIREAQQHIDDPAIRNKVVQDARQKYWEARLIENRRRR